MAATLKTYGLRETIGDRYAAAWVVDAFAKCGITYRHSERDRSAVYAEALPLFTSGRVRLLDNRRVVNQFAALERRTSPGGKDRIDHGATGADDAANAVAMALTSQGRRMITFGPEAIARFSQRAAQVRNQGGPSVYVPTVWR